MTDDRFDELAKRAADLTVAVRSTIGMECDPSMTFKEILQIMMGNEQQREFQEAQAKYAGTAVAMNFPPEYGKGN